MTEPGTYYKHSGAIPPLAPVMMLIAAAVVPIPLSFAYGYLTFHNPFIYLNFLATAGYAIAVGYSVGWLARKSHLRNLSVATLIGAMGGLIALYFAWAAYIHAVVMKYGEEDPLTYWQILDPLILWTVINNINETGLWSIGSGDTPVTGILLWILWAIEAGVIVVLAAVAARWCTEDEVYCETCGVWADKLERVSSLQAGEEEMLKRALEAKAFEPLTLLPKAPARETKKPWQGLTVDVFSCPGCDDCHHLSIRMVTITYDNKDKEQESKKTLVDRIAVPAEVARAVQSPRDAEEAPPEEGIQEPDAQEAPEGDADAAEGGDTAQA